MRYGLISDIHGNLEAFQAVLNALSKDRIDEYLCIGDIVGYGADPGPCIRLTKSLEPKALIAGNHEWGVLGLLDLEYFNELARKAVIWTKGVLSRDEFDYLKFFRLVYEDEAFALAHGTLDSPEKFQYIFDGSDAYQSMKLMKKALCFVGHSHVAGIFYSDDGGIASMPGNKIIIERDRKYIINVGSVGQPRDRDPRASYAVYDGEEGSVEIKRVGYDIETAQGKILKAGLPRELAWRLSEGR